MTHTPTNHPPAATAPDHVHRASSRATDRPVHRLGNSMSAVSRLVLAHVAQHPGCTLGNLLHTLCPEAPSGKGSTASRFSARVRYLVSVGHLHQEPAPRAPHGPAYYPGAAQRQAKPAVVLPPAQPCRVASTVYRTSTPVVPPAQYDRMHAPVYVPEPGPALRPGALAFKQCASRGYAC